MSDPTLAGPCSCGALDGEPCRTDDHLSAPWEPNMRVVRETPKAVLIQFVDSLYGSTVWVPKSALDGDRLENWKKRDIVMRYY